MEKELVIVEQVNELSEKSGIPFEYTVQELTKLSARAKVITDIEDDTFKAVKSEMVEKRNYIKQYCLDARRDIKKVAAGVSDVENILYDIFVPEENRLIELSKKAKEEKETAERMSMLPHRKEELTEIGDGVEVEDAELLKMDATAFVAYKNERMSAKIDADRLEIEKTKKAQEEAQKKLDWEAGAQAREEQVRKEERERAEEALRIQKETSEREAQEAKEQVDREAQEKLEAEQKEKDRIVQEEKDEAKKKAKRERADRYKTFRAEQGWTEETKGDFYERVSDDDTSVTLFKKVGEFDLTKLD